MLNVLLLFVRRHRVERAQSNDLFSGDDAPVGAIQRDENDAFHNEKLDSKQDVSEEEARDVLEENARVLGSTIE